MFLRFLCKQNGVIFENDIIQVGVKMESRQNLARVGMFYGNKTAQPLLNFTPNVQLTGELSSCLVAQAKPVDPTVEAGAQVQQLVNVECINDFYQRPAMQLQFRYR